MIRSPRVLAPVAAAALLSGCFQYLPATLESVAPGEEVRLFMSRQGLADVPEEIPTGRTYLTGRFAERRADSVMIQVAVSRRIEGQGAMDLRQNVIVASQEVLEVQLRELNRPRTILAIVGGALLAGALVGVVVEASGNPMNDPGDGADQLRMPLLSVPTP